MKTKRGGHVHTYPFIESDPFGPQRRHTSFVEIANGPMSTPHVRKYVLLQHCCMFYAWH